MGGSDKQTLRRSKAPSACGPDDHAVILQALVQHAEGVTFAVDVTGRLAWINPNIEAMTGYAPREIAAMPADPMPAWNLFHEDDRSRVWPCFCSAMAGESGSREPFRLLHKDGSTRWVRLSWEPLYTAEGRHLGHRVIGHDITRQIEAEEQLRHVNRQLELRVEQRTAQLEEANRRLRDEIAQREQAQQALQHSARRLGMVCSVVAHSPVLVMCWRATEGWPIEFVTDNIEQFGHSAQALLGERMHWQRKIVHETDRAKTLDQLRRHMEAGAPRCYMQYRIVDGTGRVRWIDEWVHTVADVNDKSTLYESALLDVTDRKQAEFALDESERKYRQVFATVPAVIVIFDNEQGDILEANQSAQELYGYSLEELRGLNYFKHITAEPARSMNARCNPLFPEGHRYTPLRYHLRKDGTTVPVECFGRAFKMLGREVICGVFIDITERLRQQRTLELSLRRNAALLQALPDMMFVLQRDGIFVDVEAFNDKDLLLPRQQIIGASIHDVVTDKTFTTYALDVFGRVLKTGRTEIIEYENHGHGEPRFYEARIVPLGEDTVLAVVRNVTEQHRMKRELLESTGREQRRIGRELHDNLGQQLTGLGYMTRSLARRLARIDKEKAVTASSIAEGIQEVLGEVRDICRGLVPVHVDAQGLMSALEELARNIEHRTRIHCRLSCPEPVLVRDNDIAMHLFHIAQEAANNAVKHARASRIALTLHQREGRLTLTIEDNGTGFDPLARTDDGMGLRLMRYRVHLIGGEFHVESEIEQGTRVSCHLTEGLLDAAG